MLDLMALQVFRQPSPFCIFVVLYVHPDSIPATDYQFDSDAPPGIQIDQSVAVTNQSGAEYPTHNPTWLYARHNPSRGSDVCIIAEFSTEFDTNFFVFQHYEWTDLNRFSRRNERTETSLL